MSKSTPIHGQADRASFPLSISGGGQTVVLGADLNATFSVPGLTVQTSQVNTQQDARLGTWTGPASLSARGAKPLALAWTTRRTGVLRFDTIVSSAPAGKVTIGMLCSAGCGSGVPATGLFQRLAGKGKQTVKIPLSCFAGAVADQAAVDVPFEVAADGAFSAAFANIEVIEGAAGDADTIACTALQ